MDAKGKLPHNLRLVLGMIALIVVVIFTLQNAEVVNVNFLFWRLSISRVILLLIVFCSGFLLGYILHSIRQHRK